MRAAPRWGSRGRSPGCRGTCRWPRCRGRPGGRADRRLRVRRPGPGCGGGQDHRGRPRAARAAGRGRAPRRYVSSSRTDEFGLRTVIARCEAGDAVWIEATLARVAEIIAPRHPEPPPTSSGRSRSAGSPGPPSCWPCCWSTATSRRRSTWTQAVEPEPRHRVPGRPPRRAARGRPDAAGAQGGALRPPPRGRGHTVPRRSGPGRGPRPGTYRPRPSCWPAPTWSSTRSSTSPTGSGPPPTSTPSRSRNAST